MPPQYEKPLGYMASETTFSYVIAAEKPTGTSQPPPLPPLFNFHTGMGKAKDPARRQGGTAITHAPKGASEMSFHLVVLALRVVHSYFCRVSKG